MISNHNTNRESESCSSSSGHWSSTFNEENYEKDNFSIRSRRVPHYFWMWDAKL